MTTEIEFNRYFKAMANQWNNFGHVLFIIGRYYSLLGRHRQPWYQRCKLRLYSCLLSEGLPIFYVSYTWNCSSICIHAFNTWCQLLIPNVLTLSTLSHKHKVRSSFIGHVARPSTAPRGRKVTKVRSVFTAADKRKNRHIKRQVTHH